MAVFFEEMMFDAPHAGEAELVGQTDLLERMFVHIALSGGRERTRGRKFVEQTEFHAIGSSGKTGHVGAATDLRLSRPHSRAFLARH